MTAPREKAVCDGIIRIPPYEYVHVTNLNSHVTRVILGPKTYVCLQDEKLVLGPEKMICVSKTEYCVILNPVIRNFSGELSLDEYGQVKINLGDVEYRFACDPFPLYPGECLKDEPKALPVVAMNSALRLKAIVDFTDDNDHEWIAGEEWLFTGPATYFPRKEVEVLRTEHAEVIAANTALCLKAIKDCIDQNETKRVCGEKWLVRTPGAYLPGAYEEIVETRKCYLLTDSTALHVRAIEAHIDEFKNKRRYGEEWLITRSDCDSYICNVHQEVIRVVASTVLNAHQYCIILNPVDENGYPQLGRKKLVKGEKAFFLKPGETLENGVQNAEVLQYGEGLVLRAAQGFEDTPTKSNNDGETVEKVFRQAGAEWMVRGPMEYVPPVEVQIIERRFLIPLDKNEGVYVRNKRTGNIRAVIGQAYMLTEDEELWEKKLPNEVVKLLTGAKDPASDRRVQSNNAQEVQQMNMEEEQYDFSPSLDLTRVVTYPVPHNAAIQIYDYRAKKARVVFGPNLVMLGPDEQFTQLSLSGGKPKKPNKIKALCLLLGPDFFTDIVFVETADHACLSLKLSYSWHFEVPQPCSQPDAAKLFSIPDFVGDACKAIASRIRGVVAAVPFDDFHKNSARIVRQSVFGLDEEKQLRDRFVFAQNNLHITSVDIQSVEPLDSRARESLEKSVQLAIEIRTKSQEAAAKHEAARLEQQALGGLQRQKILDEAAAEEARRALVEMRVQLATLKSTGKAKAEAQSTAEAARIEGESAIACAKLNSEARLLKTNGKIECTQRMNEAELKYMGEKNELEMQYETERSEIEVQRFTSMVSAIGPETLGSIVAAGGEHAHQLLSSMGLQTSLVTNGSKPINLLATAHGLVGQMSSGLVRNEDLAAA